MVFKRVPVWNIERLACLYPLEQGLVNLDLSGRWHHRQCRQSGSCEQSLNVQLSGVKTGQPFALKLTAEQIAICTWRYSVPGCVSWAAAQPRKCQVCFCRASPLLHQE